MWSKLYTRFSSVIVIIAFSAAVLFSTNTADAQSFFKINSNSPTQTTTTTPSDNGNSTKTIIFVAMGLAIVGALAYKFVFKKDKDTDSTKTESSSILIPKTGGLAENNPGITERQNPVPVNLYLAVRRDAVIPEQKVYEVGLSFNF